LLEHLIDGTNEMVERSRSISKSDVVYDLDDYTQDNPPPGRLIGSLEYHTAQWGFASHSIISDVGG